MYLQRPTPVIYAIELSILERDGIVIYQEKRGQTTPRIELSIRQGKATNTYDR